MRPNYHSPGSIHDFVLDEKPTNSEGFMLRPRLIKLTKLKPLFHPLSYHPSGSVHLWTNDFMHFSCLTRGSIKMSGEEDNIIPEPAAQTSGSLLSFLLCCFCCCRRRRRQRRPSHSEEHEGVSEIVCLFPRALYT